MPLALILVVYYQVYILNNVQWDRMAFDWFWHPSLDQDGIQVWRILYGARKNKIVEQFVCDTHSDN